VKRTRDYQLRRGQTTFTFVGAGDASALAQARAVAGEQNVYVMGGPILPQQYPSAGLADEIHPHSAPVLLGAGTRHLDNIGGTPSEFARGWSTPSRPRTSASAP
jgi:dihydrofolate reductase